MNHDPESREVVEGFLDGTLDNERLSQLKQALQEKPGLRASMTMELRVRGLLRARGNDSSGLGDAVALATDGFSPKCHEDRIMGIINARANPPLAFTPAMKTPPRLARAAAWLGAFTWFGNKAQAAGTAATTTGSLFTLKTASTVSLLLLLLGGGSLYLIHQDNQETTARIKQLQTRKDAILQTSTENPPTRTAIRAFNPSTTSKPAEHNTAYLDKLSESLGNLSDMREWRIATERMDEMDLETLKQLLLDAQGNQLHFRTLPAILEKMGERFPADATLLAAEVLASYPTFHKSVSNQLGDNFILWMKADPKAADQWYSAVMASGELMPKSIPGAEEESYMPERILAKHRFEALWESAPEQAVSMVGDMLEDDIAHVLSQLPINAENADTKTGLISRIVTQLPPERQNEALRGHVFSLAIKDFMRASEWLDGVVVSETVHAKLLSYATGVAYTRQKLSQSDALEIIKSLPDSPEREDARRRIERK